MKIGLLIDASTSLLNRPDDADLSPGDRGRRFINCLLYKASKPQEISLALAVFGLLNDGSLFFFSHGFKRIKLEAAAACYPRSKVDVIPITESGAQQKEYVEIDIPLSQLRHSETESSTSLENETDRCLDICKMHDYWFRPTTEAFEELSYLQIMEYYYLKPGKGPHKMALGHPMPESHNWTKNPYGKTCCGIVYGKGLPNIYDPDSNTIENREYYYKSLLLLFKPHRRKEDLILACMYQNIVTIPLPFLLSQSFMFCTTIQMIRTRMHTPSLQRRERHMQRRLNSMSSYTKKSITTFQQTMMM